MAKKSNKAKLTELERGIKSGKYIVNPEYSDSDAARDEVRNVLTWGESIENYFPQDSNKDVGKKGAWIMVLRPPPCEFTVPPFSVWFALPWPMDISRRAGHPLQRVKILTPKGDLGIFPEEYSRVNDMNQYLGREAEGILLHQLGGNPVTDRDKLHYIMSRGISRKDAMLMLINEIKHPSFLWLEIAPQYGEHFGREWPDPSRCPFATPKAQWVEQLQAS